MSNDFDWKGLVKTVAPFLGTALGGPVGGVAARAIAGAVLGDEDASQEDVAAALQKANPEMLAKLKEADQKFKVEMGKLELDHARLAM